MKRTPPLTTPEAAEHLRMKAATLEIWRCQGKGPPYMKLGRAVRYHLDDLDAFMVDASRKSTCDPGPR